MKIALSTVGFIIPAVIIYFFIVGYASKSKTAIGLVSGKLAECSSKPNCVCSEYDVKDSHYIHPIQFSGSQVDINVVGEVIKELGGDVVVMSGAYVAAKFTSSFFSFVDDFEVRIDKDNKLIHFRSASRVGHSDFGVNRKRVEQFRSILKEKKL